jgi:hypothetical protein
MKRGLSILLIFVLLMGTMTSGFAVPSSDPFSAYERIELKVTGHGIGAEISFNGAGTYYNSGINYYFSPVIPYVDENLVIELFGETQVSVANLVIDDGLFETYRDPSSTPKHAIYIIPKSELSTGQVLDFNVKWIFDPDDTSTSQQEVAHVEVTIAFEPPPTHTLTVSKDGEGTTDPAVGTHSYDEGTVVDLSADPATGWHFVEWQGPVASSGSADTTVTIEGDTEVTAIFERNEYELLVDHTGEGSTTPSGTSSHLFEDVVDLTAVPATGWHFVEWDGPVDDEFDPTTTVEIMDNTHVTASFERNEYNLTVDHTGEGSTTPDGISSHLFEDVVDLSAVPATGWHFVEWDGPVDDEFDPTTTVEILNTTYVTAEFARNEYELVVDYVGIGNTVPFGLSLHLFEDTVPVLADPAPDWFFSGWIGPNGDEVTGEGIYMDGNKAITAEFLPLPPEAVILTMDVIGEGTTIPPLGGHPFPIEAIVPLEALPAMGWEFVEWLGPVASSGSAMTTIQMFDDQFVTAVFAPIEYTLTVTHIGEGTTIPSGASTVHYGDVVQLSADPASGWMFSHWNGSVASSGMATTSVLIEGDTQVEAVFRLLPPNRVVLNVIHLGEGTTIPSGSSVYLQDTEVNLYAYPAPGWHFVTWRGPVTSYLTTTSSVVMYESTTVAAVFQPDQQERYTLYIDVDGDGTTIPTPGSHSYEPGTIVDLDAIPDSGWSFVDWVGTHGSVVSNGTIEMNGDRWITALFDEEEVEMVTLTVNIQGNGITTPDEGDHDYPVSSEPTVVDLYTSADSGWYFDRWIGDVDDDQVVMDDDKEITAVFKKRSSPPPIIIRNRLKISIEGNGTVDPFVGSQTYLPGTTVDVAADPAFGWDFDGWIGPDGAEVVNGQIEMDDDKTIVAKFVQAPTPPPIEPPEIIIPLIDSPLGDGDLPDTGQATPWLTLILGFCMMTFGYFFKKEME